MPDKILDPEYMLDPDMFIMFSHKVYTDDDDPEDLRMTILRNRKPNPNFKFQFTHQRTEEMEHGKTECGKCEKGIMLLAKYDRMRWERTLTYECSSCGRTHKVTKPTK